MEDVHLGVKRKGSTSWLFPKEVSSAATYELVSEYGREYVHRSNLNRFQQVVLRLSTLAYGGDPSKKKKLLRLQW